MKLSVVIPFHNEEGNIERVLASFLPFVGRYDFELMCVDDASTDKSAELFKHFLAEGRYGFVRCITISHDAHRGYGHAIMTGVREAKGQVIAWTHSDMQTDPADVFHAFDAYTARGDAKVIVKGKRIGRSAGDTLFSFGMATVASAILWKPFFEINAQPKLFHRSFLTHLHAAPDDFSLDLYFLYQAHMHGYSFISIPVRFHARTFGESKWAYSFSSKIKTVLRTVRYILALRKRFSSVT